ncbi:Transcriptional repressor SdpR [Pirellula sp. SH-Sr6A]|uniref:ArsR/SmtB family transcription factor n=1 Tax=Pirellula sp. SH-Sr6A TaxID=1632865 RepID=UPI00078CA035|nr:metalloregulator ArsR/SmtB family transcription factor [Pirellula sp. SH-Sr6A]AMV31538.1 Transcriptional repressor SdpR [Pirellula sp. SH-Sr6A]
MPPTSKSNDIFSAIAEPNRRGLVSLLARLGPMTVGAIVESTELSQPSVSKHLSVLFEVGVVSVDRQGKHRIYKLEAAKLKAVYDWSKSFESLWDHQLARIKTKAESRAFEARKNN